MQSETTSGQGRDDSVLEPAARPSGAAGEVEAIARLTLNGRAIPFGGVRISEPELRAIGGVPEDEVLVVDQDGHDVALLPGDTIALADSKTERVHTEKRLITVFFDTKPREISRGTYTTEQLKKLFGVQDGYILEYINEEGRLTPLKPHARLRVKECMQFFEQVPCGGSS
jgi:hypothetical protein